MSEPTPLSARTPVEPERPVRRGMRHPLLRVLNILSLLAGLALLVAVSWEILLGNPRHYSYGYLLLQGGVCIVFLIDFFCTNVGLSAQMAVLHPQPLFFSAFDPLHEHCVLVADRDDP